MISKMILLILRMFLLSVLIKCQKLMKMTLNC